MKMILLTAALLSAAVLPAAAASRDHPVALKNIAITPKLLRIHRGDTVTWRWGDKPIDAMHSVTSDGKRRFKSAPEQFTGTHTVRFSRKGTYTYHCTVHPTAMNGKIIVR